MLRVGLPSSVRLCFGQPCSPCERGRFRRPSPRSSYTYTPSGASPAVIVSLSKVPLGFGPKQSRAVHPRELGKRRMRSSLPSGKSATPPARCIHRPQRDTSSAEYRLLVSHASCGASRELSSRRSPALIPHTCAVSSTFRYGAFLFVVFALADLSSACLASCVRGRASIRRKQRRRSTLTGKAGVSPAPWSHINNSAANPTRYTLSTNFVNSARRRAASASSSCMTACSSNASSRLISSTCPPSCLP